MKLPVKPKLPPLPLGIVPSDLEYPTYGKNMKDYEKKRIIHTLKLYYVGEEGAFGRDDQYTGWMITTLHIANAKRRAPGQETARTYAVDLKGNVVRIGNGPHVTHQITVMVRQDRLKDLKPLVDLYIKGCADAGAIRDRISTRRAQGQIYRAEGRRSWTW